MRPAVCRSVGRGAAVGQSDGLRVFERGSILPKVMTMPLPLPSTHASTYSVCCLDGGVHDYGHAATRSVMP